jgi:hypothetical protein
MVELDAAALSNPLADIERRLTLDCCAGVMVTEGGDEFWYRSFPSQAVVDATFPGTIALLASNVHD